VVFSLQRPTPVSGPGLAPGWGRGEAVAVRVRRACPRRFPVPPQGTDPGLSPGSECDRCGEKRRAARRRPCA